MIYAYNVHWAIAPAFLLTIPLLGVLSSVLSRTDQDDPEVDRRRDDRAGRRHDGVPAQHRAREESRPADQEVNRLNATTDKILQLELKKVRYLRSLSFIQGTCVNFLRTSILFLMLYLIFTQQITVGQFFSLLIYSFFIFGPLQELGNVINIYRETEASLDELPGRSSRCPSTPKPAHPAPVGELRTLDFDDVSFTHQTGIGAGAVGYLIRGRARRDRSRSSDRPAPARRRSSSCSSVSTSRSRDASSTTGIGQDEVDLDDLRERIGLVTQDAQLFSGSIRENLLFVRPDATDAECLDVLQQGRGDTLLARADKGLDTVIGEGGVKVSGGEKQRLSIARALLRHPHLLVFDEATSALDSLTEEEISRTMREIAASDDVITVLIAHRLSTVMHADRIHVLERGAIVESGRHEELLARGGLYTAMWRQQVGEGERRRIA